MLQVVTLEDKLHVLPLVTLAFGSVTEVLKVILPVLAGILSIV